MNTPKRRILSLVFTVLYYYCIIITIIITVIIMIIIIIIQWNPAWNMHLWGDQNRKTQVNPYYSKTDINEADLCKCSNGGTKLSESIRDSSIIRSIF